VGHADVAAGRGGISLCSHDRAFTGSYPPLKLPRLRKVLKWESYCPLMRGKGNFHTRVMTWNKDIKGDGRKTDSPS
jgi:hypothetical protein